MEILLLLVSSLHLKQEGIFYDLLSMKVIFYSFQIKVAMLERFSGTININENDVFSEELV